MENINELVKYDITDAAIAQYRDELMPLTINGIEDKEGYQKVNDARLFIKAERVSVEKSRVEFKAAFLEGGRRVDAEAKRITAGLSEIEEHLEIEKRKVDDENARIKFEKEQRNKLPDRMKALEEIGAVDCEVDLLKLDDLAFSELLNQLKADQLQRQAEVQAKKERELNEAQEKVNAEKRALEEAKLEAEREKTRQAELEQARKDAATKATLEAELEAKRKENARVEAEKQAKLEAERLEAERPDKEKLKSFAMFFETSLSFPEVSNSKAAAKLAKVRRHVQEIVDELRSD